MNDKILPFDKENLSEPSLDRITAMALRKAGITEKESNEMNNIYAEPLIKAKRTTDSKKDEDVYDNRVRGRRGGLVAACVAFLLVGTAGAFVLFGKDLETEPPRKTPASQFHIIGQDSSDDEDSLTETIETTSVTTETPDSADDPADTADNLDSSDISSSEEDAVETTVTEEYPEQITPEPADGDKEHIVTVPNVVGLTQPKAISVLKECGLDYEVHEIRHKGDKGKVIEQSIAPDESVDRGTVVIIYVSTGEPELVEMTLKIPVPADVKGSFIFDVYLDGTVVYTKTVSFTGSVAGDTVSIEIIGYGKETLAVYVKNVDTDIDNYIKYATYNVDYDTKSIELDGELNERDFIAAQDI